MEIGGVVEGEEKDDALDQLEIWRLLGGEKEVWRRDKYLDQLDLRLEKKVEEGATI